MLIFVPIIKKGVVLAGCCWGNLRVLFCLREQDFKFNEEGSYEGEDTGSY